MTKSYRKHQICDIERLKQTLRLTDVTAFDDDLDYKLRAAIAAAGANIGRDLNLAERYSFVYAGDTALEVDSARHISQITANGSLLNDSDWYVAEGFLHLENVSAGAAVVVDTEFNEDIVEAVLMHAAYIWNNPVDGVESLPKASRNLLKPYRKYGR